MSEIYNLLTINGIILPNPESGFEIALKSNYNTYTGEDGGNTIELIRDGIISVNVTYGGLLEDELALVSSSLQTVSEVALTDPTTGQTRTFNALISNIKQSKRVYKDGFSIWGISFSIDEL